MNKAARGCQTYMFFGLAIVVVIAATLVALAFLWPQAFLVVINILWVVLFVVVVIFLFLGLLVMVGLKDSAARLIDIMLEGSLSMLDLAAFFKDVLEMFRKILRDFILFLAPVLACISAVFMYLGLMYFYKSVGRNYDVFWLTMGLTAALIFIIGVLNPPSDKKGLPTAFWQLLAHKFTHTLRDALEIVILAFFVTMDSTKLFFLPKELNVELHASLGGMNMMVKGFQVDEHFKITLTMVMAAIFIEIVRNVLRLGVSATKNFRYASELLTKQGKNFRNSQLVKLAFRYSVKSSMDDVLKFITFTTVVIVVFLFFPRMKIGTMIVASAVALLLDLIIWKRLTAERGDDLLSRIIVKIFRL